MWKDATTQLFPDPSDPWLYRFLASDGEILYIGQTSWHPAIRFKQHAKDASRGRRVDSYATWWPRVTRAETAQVPADCLNEFESALIHQFHPVGNRHCPVEDCKTYVFPNGAHLAAVLRYNTRVGR